jgi:lysophospholipase L1-like esterase
MILTLGDSVNWGQGLLEEHKFDTIVAAQKGMQLKPRAAHSGAVIGTPNDSSSEVDPGEVPVGPPSVWQQLKAQSDWSQVELVLLNGGINDVSLTRILNPLTSTALLTQLVDQFCNQAMSGLLVATANKLTMPGARIAVIGYYPIFSDQSDPADLEFRAMMELHGLATTSVFATDPFSVDHVAPKVVENSITFWQQSNQALQSAVDAANGTLGKNVCTFVKLPFTEVNALWAKQSLLWELTPLLMAEDEVVGARGQACDAVFGDLIHLPKLLQCQRASVGHPKVQGAATIAQAIAAAV